jgi:hypothetical protein
MSAVPPEKKIFGGFFVARNRGAEGAEHEGGGKPGSGTTAGNACGNQ